MSDTQLLSFALGEETYAVDILKVQEIKTWEGATRLPHTAAHVRGVMNLRGEIVPVLDLRRRFDMDQSYGARPVVIVFRVGKRIAGAMVDAVCDVHRLPAESVQPTPELGRGAISPFISGLATAGEEMLILLDIDRLFEEDM